jgi:RHS repeat-associated protein
LVNTNASTAARYQYDPFGNTILADDADSSGTVSENPFRFSTKYTDDETELVYYGYRYYSPELGRWPSRDPAGEAGGIGLYRYAANDPLNSFDRFGLAEEKWFDVSYDIPDDCPPCPCLENPNKCKLNITWLKDYSGIRYHKDGEVVGENAISYGITLTKVGEEYKLSGGPVVYVYLSSTDPDDDVRNCKLQQDIVNKYAKYFDGSEVTTVPPVKEGDYSPDTPGVNYGGWWLIDWPGFRGGVWEKAHPKPLIPEQFFFQAKVFVVGNDDLKMYWGFKHEILDWDTPKLKLTEFGPLNEASAVEF